MSNPTGINQYTKGGSERKAIAGAIKKERSKALSMGWNKTTSKRDLNDQARRAGGAANYRIQNTPKPAHHEPSLPRSILSGGYSNIGAADRSRARRAGNGPFSGDFGGSSSNYR